MEMRLLQFLVLLLNVGASTIEGSAELLPTNTAPHWDYAPEPGNSRDLPLATWLRRSLALSSLFSPPDIAASFPSALTSHMPAEFSLLAGAPEPDASASSTSRNSAPETVAFPESSDSYSRGMPYSSSPSLPPAPNAGNHLWRSSTSPHHFTVHSPLKTQHPKAYKTGPAPSVKAVPPFASSPSVSPVFAPSDISAASIPSLAPHVSPVISPSDSSTIYLKEPAPAPSQAPSSQTRPPQKDCGPLICPKPLTYSTTQSLCQCVLPMQVALRLSVASYVFLSMVPELSAEIAEGVFMKQGQVHITDATAAPDNAEKTIVLVDLLPIGEKIDSYTANVIFRRFWNKKVSIKASVFGDYDVLYVRYPGLPRSPPSPPFSIGIIASRPYPGRDNNTRAIQPFGVDVRGRQHKHGFRGSILAIIVISCSVALILMSAIAWILLFRYRCNTFKPYSSPPNTFQCMAKASAMELSLGSRPSSPSFSFGSSIAAYMGSARKFSSREIEQATDFFDGDRIVGEGGFGRVYSGVLEDGTKVGIKILKRFDRQSSREFLAEVEMLSRLHHRNLVKLIGICVEDRMQCLVYELIPNGSLESHLHGTDKERSPLHWNVRLKIALGAARALAYLHEDSSPHVIHRDFKASNILLEDDFTPRVSDFGLARTALDEENRHISTRVMGTFGYVAPEYAMTGHLLVKSDVYSYGVVLLELLTGRTPVDMSRSSGEENLVSWARPLLTSREGLEVIIDQSLGPDFPLDSIAKVAAIASMCVQPEVSNRPFMGEVVQALKLVCNERDRANESPSGNGCAAIISDQIPAASQFSPSPGYDYLLELERDLTMSELLTSSAQFGNDDVNEPVRRHSSSGPLRTGKRKALWKTMREFKRSMSEHGMPYKLWPGSH